MAVTPYGGRALLQVRTTRPCSNLTGDTRKIFVSKTVDESHSARFLIGCKPISSNKIVSSAYLNSNVIIDFDFAEGVITFAAISCL